MLRLLPEPVQGGGTAVIVKIGQGVIQNDGSGGLRRKHQVADGQPGGQVQLVRRTGGEESGVPVQPCAGRLSGEMKAPVQHHALIAVGRELAEDLRRPLSQGGREAVLQGGIGLVQRLPGQLEGGVFGLHGQATGCDEGMNPVITRTGIQVISTNLLLANETDPVVWRGPIISGVVQQFWTDVLWNCDYLFVDMPPGTGDVSLSVFQSIPLDGIVIVASPQDLVSMVVEKAVKMAEMMEVPIVGVVENMSYVACPDCGKKIHLFGQGKTAEAAARHNLPLLAEMPIDPALAALVDAGDIESFQGSWLDAAADKLEGK